ncbi:heat-inducible transcriptional repressor HrcA, partial [Bacillus altitudinis]|nr:heat-inducible transcriptional repressor HrcA [Bacillus altitudinis]
SDIEKLMNILNSRLAGVPMDQLKDRMYKEVVMLLRTHLKDYDHI